MRPIVVMSILMFIALAPVAAAEGQKQPAAADKTAASVEVVNVAGTWAGEFIQVASRQRLTLRLTQKGEMLEGNFDSVGGRRDLFNLPVRGSVQGTTVVLERTDRGPFSFELTIEGDEMKGRYTGIFGPSTVCVMRTPVSTGQLKCGE